MTSSTVQILRDYFARLELYRQRKAEIRRLVQLRRVVDAARAVN